MMENEKLNSYLVTCGDKKFLVTAECRMHARDLVRQAYQAWAAQLQTYTFPSCPAAPAAGIAGELTEPGEETEERKLSAYRVEHGPSGEVSIYAAYVAEDARRMASSDSTAPVRNLGDITAELMEDYPGIENAKRPGFLSRAVDLTEQPTDVETRAKARWERYASKFSPPPVWRGRSEYLQNIFRELAQAEMERDELKEEVRDQTAYEDDLRDQIAELERERDEARSGRQKEHDLRCKIANEKEDLDELERKHNRTVAEKSEIIRTLQGTMADLYDEIRRMGDDTRAALDQRTPSRGEIATALMANIETNGSYEYEAKKALARADALLAELAERKGGEG